MNRMRNEFLKSIVVIVLFFVGGLTFPVKGLALPILKLPYSPNDSRWYVSQGNNGSYDHYLSGMNYAWDFSISGSTDLGYPIFAPAAGIVTEVYYTSDPCGISCNGGWGNGVVIDFDDGDSNLNESEDDGFVKMTHMFRVYVVKGQRIKQGQVVGLVGSTGWSTSAHIHYQVQNGGSWSSSSIPSTFSDSDVQRSNGIPQENQYYLSSNTNLFDLRHSTSHAGSTITDIIGQKDGSIHWWYTQANPITNEIISSGDAKGMSQNTYVQEYAGKNCTINGTSQFCDGVIVYDALGGARSAYLLWYQQFGGYSGSGGWNQLGGPRSTTLRNPITNSYWSPSDNCWRQDFQMGWLCYEIWHGYDSGDVAPGVYDPWGNIFSDVRRWDPTTSYAFAEAYERNGAAVNLGSTDSAPNETPFVHNWTVNGATVRLQDFNGGAWGDAALIYNPNTGNAHAVLWGFWNYYRYNAGPSLLGAPTEEEHVDRCPHQACQSFNNGYLSWEYGYDIFPISWTAETRAFSDAYGRYPKADLGFARDDGGGIFIHNWTINGYTVKIQNFNNGNWGNNALMLNPASTAAYSLKWGFWDHYRYNAGPQILGAPLEDEHPQGTPGCNYPFEACQRFERGMLVWDYSGLGIRVVP